MLGRRDTPVLRWFAQQRAGRDRRRRCWSWSTASMAAYALARMEFRGQAARSSATIVATLFVPPVS